MRYIALQVLLVLLLLGGEDCTALLGGERQLNSNSEKQQQEQEQIDKTAGDRKFHSILFGLKGVKMAKRGKNGQKSYGGVQWPQ